MSSEPNGWVRHWDAVAKLYKRRARCYAGLVPSPQIARMEHQLQAYLSSLRLHWDAAEPDLTKPEEVFAGLLCCLCNEGPEALTKAWTHLETLLQQQAEQEDTERWQALATALHLALPLKPATTDWSGLFEVGGQYPQSMSRLATLPWQPRELDLLLQIPDVAPPYWIEPPRSEDGAVAAIRSVLLEHNPGPLLARQTTEVTEPVVLAYGLAANLGSGPALDWLTEQESRHPAWVMRAYGLAGTPEAIERLLVALSVPHLAAHAATPWQLMTGQTLDWEPAIGPAGGGKKAGPKMPDDESAQRWWRQHSQESGAWVEGKAVTVEGITQALRLTCGAATQPLWWLWQFQQRRALPDLVGGWHSERLRNLGLNHNREEGGHAA